jgi:hypothetical protein
VAHANQPVSRRVEADVDLGRIVWDPRERELVEVVLDDVPVDRMLSHRNSSAVFALILERRSMTSAEPACPVPAIINSGDGPVTAKEES